MLQLSANFLELYSLLSTIIPSTAISPSTLGHFLQDLETLTPAKTRAFSKKYTREMLKQVIEALNKSVAVNDALPPEILSNIFFKYLSMIPADLKDSKGAVFYPREIPKSLYKTLTKLNVSEFEDLKFSTLHDEVGHKITLDIITNARLGNFLPIKGNSGSYSIVMKEKTEQNRWKTTYLSIAKPDTEEPLAKHNPFITQRIKRWFAKLFHFTGLTTQAGQGIYGEAAAYQTGLWVKNQFKKDLPDIVPYTEVIKNFKLPKRQSVPTDKHPLPQGGREEWVSLQIGVPDNIEARKLLHIDHHYNAKRIPPRFEGIKNFFRKLVGLKPLESPWKRHYDGKWIYKKHFDKAQEILNDALSEQFYLMAVHNYLINDVDKHSDNWFIVGDYKKFIDQASMGNYQEAKIIAETFTIASIDNGASFAPNHPGRWDFFQTRNRMQYDKLPVAKKSTLDAKHIAKLWENRLEFATKIFDQYKGSEASSITQKRIWTALERLSALYQMTQQKRSKPYTIADLCKKLKFGDQIKALLPTKAHNDIQTTVAAMLNPTNNKKQRRAAAPPVEETTSMHSFCSDDSFVTAREPSRRTSPTLVFSSSTETIETNDKAETPSLFHSPNSSITPSPAPTVS